jgi:hypothetical protein
LATVTGASTDRAASAGPPTALQGVDLRQHGLGKGRVPEKRHEPATVLQRFGVARRGRVDMAIRHPGRAVFHDVQFDAEVVPPRQRDTVVIGEVRHRDDDVMRLSVRQGDRDIGRRCERGKVQRHQAEAVGFKADGHARMGDRDGRIRVARRGHAKGDHRRIGGLGADIQAAGQAEGAEFGGGFGSATGAPGSGRAVDGLKAAGRMSAAAPSVAMAGRAAITGASANPEVSGRSIVSA